MVVVMLNLPMTRTIASNGYVLIWVGKQHHLADIRGYAYEHRVVAEAKIGRRLRPGEQVHHKNHDKVDNSPDNLEVYPSIKWHRVAHRRNTSQRRMPDELNILISGACGCGSLIYQYGASGRPRRFISGHNSQRVDYPKCACGCGRVLSYTARRNKAVYFRGHPVKQNVPIECACGCGRTLLRYDPNGRIRQYISGHNRGNYKHGNYGRNNAHLVV